jgi:hypothetical protein
VKLTKLLLVISGALAVGIGLAMMLATRAFLEPEGIAVDATTAVIGQAQGALLVGIGAINLLSVRVRDRAALRAVLGGNVVVHVVALAVNVHALAAHLVGSGVTGDAVGHILFAGAFACALGFAARRPAGGLAGLASAPTPDSRGGSR